MAEFEHEEAARVQALIRRLYERSNARSWSAFAIQAGVSDLSLGEWRRGEVMPNAVNLLRLLAAVNMVGPRFELPDELEEAPGSLEAEVARLASLVTEGFDRVERLLDRDGRRSA